jgi:hypothetical protein
MCWVDSFVAWLKDWQTLVAGLLAIGAAFIGGRYIMVQVREAQRQENDRLARAYAGARASMPLALSAVSEYAMGCGRLLRPLLAQAKDETIPHQEIAFPPLPVEVIAAFQRIVETATEPKVSEVFARFLGALQVQAARLRSMEPNLSPTAPSSVHVFSAELEERILDAAVIWARAAALFEFARGKSDEPPLEFKGADRLTALHLMGFYDYEQERLYETANRRSNFSMLSATI